MDGIHPALQRSPGLLPQFAYRGLEWNALARFMIEKAHMAVTPSAALGRTAAQNIRLTVATWMANLRQAIVQIK